MFRGSFCFLLFFFVLVLYCLQNSHSLARTRARRHANNCTRPRILREMRARDRCVTCRAWRLWWWRAKYIETASSSLPVRALMQTLFCIHILRDVASSSPYDRDLRSSNAGANALQRDAAALHCARLICLWRGATWRGIHCVVQSEPWRHRQHINVYVCIRAFVSVCEAA